MLANNDYLVYILECSDGSLYTGITNNIKKRLQMHTSGKASKFTRTRLPIKLVYTEGDYSKSTALSRELAIKKLAKTQKLALINAVVKNP